MIDSEVAEFLPSTISRTGLPPKREAFKLPNSKEAKKINQEMLRAMDYYTKRVNAQHIHQFLRFSHRKPKRISPDSTMSNPNANFHKLS